MRVVAVLAVVMLGALVVSSSPDAQQPSVTPRIGVLWPWSPSDARARVDVFREALRALGYDEGQNIVVEHRHASAPDEFSALAVELVDLAPDVIVAGGTPATLALKNATSEIPVVFFGAGDPIAAGLVASLARPGGNITGVSVLTTELGTRWIELVKEAAPRVSRVAVLWVPENPTHAPLLKNLEAGARALDIQVQPAAIRSSGDVAGALAAVKDKRAGAVVVLPDPLTTRQARPIARFTNTLRLPTVAGFRQLVDAGGLISYTADPGDLYRGLAAYVDRILKGAKPADLPVQQPSEFELVINLKAAKALGLSLPDSLLTRASEIIR
jgi:putative ABC transport system substrate-binding protein